MDKRPLLLAPALLFVLAVSGCTVPGTDTPIPFLSDIFGGGTTISYENDIIVIRNLQVTPATRVKAGQTLTFYADIENRVDPELSREPVTVKPQLYDHCTSLFTLEDNNCKEEMSLDPREIKTCWWKLKPRPDVKLTTPCELKVKVTYHHTTDAVTSVTFIDAAELENRIRRGESWKVGNSESRGYGPVKPYLQVETQQPVPVDDNGGTAQISMQIRNVGSGYVPGSAIPAGGIDTEGLDADGGLEADGCEFKANKDGKIKLIRRETSPVFCSAAAKDVGVEQTYDMSMSVSYDYEFRKSISVQVLPSGISGGGSGATSPSASGSGGTAGSGGLVPLQDD